MIKAEDLSVSFGNRVLFSSVSFAIGKGIFQLKGDSGKGKTTLRNILRKQQTQDYGKVFYSEESPSFSYCGPKATLLSEYSLQKNLVILNKPLNKDRLAELMAGLRFPYLEKPIIHLSGGERRKAELLLCLSYDADYYFLDEPFASLDKESRKFLTSFLNEFSKDHSVILISHEVNQDIALSGRLDLNYVERIKQKREKIKIHRKGTFRRLPAFLDDRKRNRMSNFICGLLGILSLIAFSFGVAFTQSRTITKRTRTARKEDPFSAHYLNPVSVTDFPREREFYGILNDKGRTKLTLHQKNQNGSLSLFGCIKDSTSPFFFYSQKKANPRIKENQDAVLNGIRHPVEIIEKDRLSSLNLPDCKERKELLDDKQDGEYLFCSNTFVDQVISSLAEGFQFSSDSFFPLNPIVYDSYRDVLALGTSGKDKCMIEDGDFLLAVPGKKKGESVFLSQSAECKVTNEYDDNFVHLSPIRYKLIYLANDFSEETVSLLIEDKDFSSLARFNSQLRGKDLIYSADFGLYPIICYVVSSALLFGELLYCLVSYSGIKRWRNSLYHLYQNNGFSASSFRIGLLLSKAAVFLPSLILSFLLYFLLALPFANYKERTRIYDKRRDGFYYYSQQPQNGYYDSIRHPVPFETYQPYIFLLLVLFTLFVLIQWIILSAGKGEGNRKNKD